MIKVQGLNKSFQNEAILKDLSFEVSQGQTLALLGLSGSGKTTALKIICGLYTPDSGTVIIEGKLLDESNLQEIRRGLGYVIQDGGLFPHLTARENITLVGNEVSLSPEHIKARISELTSLVNISPEILDRYPREISGGQRQRIGIMRALFLDPSILLLDEPMGALDPITRLELQTELKDLFKRLHKTVVLVTHDLHEASFLADKILLLNDGEISQLGSMRELVDSPRNSFVEKFIQAQRQHL